MKFALLALVASATANATTGDYQQCDSDIVCEEGSKCCTASQSTKPTMKICAPWVHCPVTLKDGFFWWSYGCLEN